MGWAIPLRILVVAVAVAYGALPTQVCVPHGQGRGGVHWMGGHSHAAAQPKAHSCPCGHCHHDGGSEAPDGESPTGHDEGCCSDSPFDLRAPGAAVALVAPGIGAVAALAAAAGIASIEEVATEGDRRERERGSVVLIL